MMILLFGYSGSAQASILFQATLTGAAEVPQSDCASCLPVIQQKDSPGTGFVTVRLNDAEDSVRINLTFSNLLGNEVLDHIHCCALPGVAAPVRIEPPSLPLGQLVDVDVAIPDPLPNNPALTRAAFVQGLKDGLAYFNIHSDQWRSGEIRGQLQAVPAPISLLLLGSGLIGVGAVTWRRRRP
jgi:hypothetical protein